MRNGFIGLATAATLAFAAPTAVAHDFAAKRKPGVPATWELVRVGVNARGNDIVFSLTTSGRPATTPPAATGKVPGAGVHAYVWPTSLDSSAVGFERNQGILALAVTAHPDFDDTPLADENRDGNADNDGVVWHSHWVVLVKDAACGEAGLKVKDVPAGTKAVKPWTAPDLPILLDSPGYYVERSGRSLSVRLPRAAIGNPANFNFDGVTSALKVNGNLHDPFLCVTGVWSVASGDLSLPGRLR